MFYCDKCRSERAWPESLFKSLGPCEMCGTTDVCNSVASKLLPLPNPNNTNKEA